MKTKKKPCFVIALVVVLACFVAGSTEAGTVLVETSSGAGACATYYTQSGDWATGDAAVSGTGAIDLTTEGSVEKGLVRSETAGGDRAFAPFTGNFTASTGGGAATATSTNARVDIFVVSQPGNSTVGNYTIDGVPGTPFPRFHDLGLDLGAVDAADADVDPNPDWILVDQGSGPNAYDEQVTINAFEQNSALTSVWGRDDTVIDTDGAAGHAVDVDDTPGFAMEGFTVTRAGSDGINVDNSPDARIICNTVTNSGDDGIDVEDSDDVLIRRNIATDNTVHGISVDGSDGARITYNEATLNDEDGIFVISSDNAQIRRNTVTENLSGITAILNGGSLQITDNTVRGNPLSGIAALLNPGDVRIADNTVTGSLSGILAVGNASQLAITSGGGGAALLNSEASVETALNAVTESIKDIEASLNPITETADNAVPVNLSGIAGALNVVESAVNTVTERIDGVAAVLDGLPIADSVAAGNAEGLTPMSNGNANVEITGNTVRNNASGIIAALNNVDVLVDVSLPRITVGITPVAGGNTEISRNNVSDNFSGIATVLNPNTRISDNNVTGSLSSLSGIATALNNVDVLVGVDLAGVDVNVDVTAAAGANTVIRRNNVSDNFSGILSVLDANTVIRRNNVTGNFSGIATALNNLDVQAAYDDATGVTTIDVTAAAGSNTVIDLNNVTDNVSGILSALSYNTQITDNTVALNDSGIAAALNNIDVLITVDGGIDVDLTPSAVSNTVISGNDVNNNLSGIAALGNPNTQITDNDIADNFSGIYLGGLGILPDPLTGATINDNNIQGNQAWGLFNDTTNPVGDATNNWWGSASGPGGIGPGTGDAVVTSGAGVNFFPWRTTPAP